MTRSRWPRWIYESGNEPDYRFSFANERTFLAWIRTALALIAGGVAVKAISLSMPSGLQRCVAAVLVVLGLACAIAAWTRWALAERAIRQQRPLPGSPLGVVLMVAIGVVAVALAVVVLV